MYTNTKPKLITIRGNSGSGKTTLAKELRLAMVKKGLATALIEQDYFRRVVLQEKERENGDNIQLIEQTAKFALKRGYSVVLEGILSFERYGTMLKRLQKSVEHIHIYYLDIPFEETVRRHGTKPNAHEFGEKEMREWWQDKDLTYFGKEKIISAESTLEQSVQMIVSDLHL